MKKKISKLLALFLAVALMLPNSIALAVEGLSAPEAGATADTSTLTSWQTVFGSDTLSTKDVGRIWTDKTVSTDSMSLNGDIGDVVIDKENGADFQVALSALGSAADITDTTKVPTDTVLVLDLSNNMWVDNYADIDEMISAVNEALKTLMNANEQNRVVVVGFSTTSTVLLPLGHYLPGSTFLSRSGDTLNMAATSDDGQGTQVTGSFERLTTNSHKYTQSGIYTGMNLLLQADTTAVVGETTVTRAPVMILMAEGEAKYGSRYFINPSASADITEVGQRATSRYAQSFVAAMTAAYMKEQVTDHYYGESGESARVYTLGVDISGCDAPELAYAYLDPAQTVPENFSATGGDKGDPTSTWALNYFKEKFNDYNSGGTAAIHTGSGAAGAAGWQEVNITKADNNNVTVGEFEYNDQYYEISDANWDEIFSQIANDVSHQAPSAPTNVSEGAEGSGGESGKLVFTDQLGAYMKVSGLPTIVFAGQKFQATSSNANGDTTTYTFTGEVVGNEIYGTANLSNIKLTVMQNGDYQTLKWEIPANLLPLRSITVKGDTNEAGQTSYTITEENPAYPIRLFYSVEKDDTVVLDAEDNDYILKNSNDGLTSYYAGRWDAENERGSAAAVFTPASGNAFYHYTEDTPLYVLHNNSRGYLTTQEALANNVELIDPQTASGGVMISGTSYTLVRATEYNADCAYYYAHTYYEETENGADRLTDYHRVQNTANLVDNTTTDGNERLYVKEGTNKLSRVSDVKVNKEENKTGTAETCRDPEYTLAENATVTIYLGNNGLLKEKTPTGSLSVKLNPSTGDGADAEQQFTFTVGLYGPNGVDENGDPDYVPLTGEFEYTITASDAEDPSETTGTIKNGGTVELGENETLVISGLPAGVAWNLTEQTVPGYTPAYSGDGQEGAKWSGQLIYVGTGSATKLDKNVVVTNNFDSTKVTYSLNYNANRIDGTTSAVPSGSRPHGEDVIDLPSMTHGEVDGKKVIFLGWYDGDQKDVNQIYGKEDKYAFTTVQNAVIEEENDRHRFYAADSDYTMPARDVTLYAVWGYDENGDDRPDVEEGTYTLTYNANGGNFGDSGDTKTVDGLLKQNDYALDYTTGNIPTRTDAPDGTKYAFVAWSATEDDHIYTFNDTQKPNGLSNIDITKNTTVYAVWGIDTDGDGIPDLRETSYTVTAAAGDGGSIAPNGEVPVMEGQDQVFTITADSGKAVDTIKVEKLDEEGDVSSTETYSNKPGEALPDGQSWTSWTIKNVNESYNITVTFADSEDGQYPDKYNRTLTYDANGGKGAPEKATGLEDNVRYTLSTQKPTHDPVEYGGKTDVKVVFLGWMTTDESGKIYGYGDTAPTTVTSVTPRGSDVTVYAAWGYDSDGDDVPDIEETSYTITATAETGGSVSPNGEVSVMEGQDKTFTITPEQGKAVDTIKVEKLDEEGAVSSTETYSNTPDEVLPDGQSWTSWTIKNVNESYNITVTFADSKDSQYPDKYNRTLTYDANGGSGAPGDETGLQDGVEHKLSDKKPTHDSVEYGGKTDVKVVFLGWMTTDDSGKIYGYGDTAPMTVTSVTPRGSDVTVYAAWGYDSDGDDVPDIQETYYKVTAEASNAEGGSVSPKEASVQAGTNQSFEITANQNWALKTITVNGTEVYRNDDASNPFSGTWTLEKIQQDSKVVVEFGADVNGDNIPDEYVPVELSGTIKVDTNEWKDFLNTITFGLFFKDTQTVTITGSGADDLKISYFLSEEDLTEEAVKENTGWIEYSEEFSIAPDSNQIVYARITDSNGNNAVYLRSDRIVVDATAPAFSLENNKTYTEAQTLTVSDNYALKSVLLNDVEQLSSDFTGKQTQLSLNENGTYTVKAADKAGNESAITVVIDIPPVVVHPNLTGITAPEAITGVANGTPMESIQLPDEVTIQTTDGEMQASVSWNTSAANYDPSNEEVQTFTVSGTVTLPEGVDNTNGISLETSISITVDAKAEVVLTGVTVKENPVKTVYTEGETLDLSGLVVTLTYSDGTGADVAFADFAANEITVSPANETVLNTTHTKATVSKGGFTADVQLTVNAMAQVETPVFSPAGGNYTEAQMVEISTATEDAVIYYTTDGSEPTAESTKYTGAIAVDQSMTIKAVAVKDGMKDSEIASASYLINIAEEFTVTVENGSGSGQYKTGVVVSIKADAAPEGKVFDKWVSGDDIEFVNAGSAETTFEMIGSDVTVTATYKDITPVNPDDPSGKPDDPSNPDDSKDPGTGDPTDNPSGTGGSGSGNTDGTEPPQTGDSSNFILWFAICIASGANVLILFVLNRRNNRKAKHYR